MAEFKSVAKVGAVPEGQGRAFSVDGKIVAVFLVNGEYSAINDLCPHMGASLASGYVEDGNVMCPWHAWRFCVKDGLWVDNPKSNIRTACYQVRVEGDFIQVMVPDEGPATTGSTESKQ